MSTTIRLENIFFQIAFFYRVLQLRLHIVRVHDEIDLRRVAVARVEGHVGEDALEHRVQAARADVFAVLIRLKGMFSNGVQRESSKESSTLSPAAAIDIGG